MNLWNNLYFKVLEKLENAWKVLGFDFGEGVGNVKTTLRYFVLTQVLVFVLRLAANQTRGVCKHFPELPRTWHSQSDPEDAAGFLYQVSFEIYSEKGNLNPDWLFITCVVFRVPTQCGKVLILVISRSGWVWVSWLLDTNMAWKIYQEDWKCMAFWKGKCVWNLGYFAVH